MTKEPLVDIVILNWNSLDDTYECVDSVLNNDYENFKIILIDNGSKGDDVKNLERKYLGSPMVCTIANDSNLGFAGGCNVGIRKSIDDKAEYTLFLNNDTIVAPEFLTELMVTARCQEGTGIVASKVFYYERPDEVWAPGINFNFYFPPFSKGVDSKVATKVSDVVGCSMLIKNEVFKTVGVFDEEYFAYGEESDLNFRARKCGYEIWYCPHSLVWHKVSASTGGGFNPTVAYYKMRNKIKFARKNYPLHYWPTYAIFLTAYFIKEQARAILAGELQTSKALIRGLKDAF